MSFQTDGYKVFEGMIPPADLAMLQTTCDTLLDEPPEDGGDGLHTIGLGQARRFLRHRHKDFPALERFILGPIMRRVAEDCLGAPPLLFNEQFVVKGAGKGASFAWHQDSAYVGFDHAPYLTVWIALDDTTEENGCVYLIPRDIAAEPGIDPHDWVEESNELNGYTGPDTGRAMTCPAGTVVAFSSLTLHRSGPNTTAAPRRAYLAQYSTEAIIDPATGAPKRFATPLT